MPADIRTKAIILRRTNYREADRILNLITPEGKVSALAKAARKEKSRLAGGIELFTVADVVIHQSKSQGMGILTSAKMLKFYGGILADFDKLTLASDFLKKIAKFAENNDSPEYFDLLRQSLNALDKNIAQALVETWFYLNLSRINGEEINLVRDNTGENLSPDLRYNWDYAEKALRLHPSGQIGASEIKVARFLLANPLMLASSINQVAEIIPALKPIMQSVLENQ